MDRIDKEINKRLVSDVWWLVVEISNREKITHQQAIERIRSVLTGFVKDRL